MTAATAVTLTVTDMAMGSRGAASYTVAARVISEPGPMQGHWKGYLKPTQAGGNLTITASCAGCGGLNPSTIHSVTFGDVFVCSGQSNMQLSMIHTFDR